MADIKVNELPTSTPALTDKLFGIGASEEYQAEISGVANVVLKNYSNSSLETTSKNVVGAINELNDTTNRLEETTNEILTGANEVISEATKNWLDENVTPTGSAVVVDSSLKVDGAAADAKATGDAFSSGLITQASLSNNVASFKNEGGNSVFTLDFGDIVPPVDDTLSNEGVPADAKAVGDAVNDLKSDLNAIQYLKTFDSNNTLTGFIGVNGVFASNASWAASDFIYTPMYDGGEIVINSVLYGNGGLAFYDENKNCITYINGNNASDYGFTSSYEPVERIVTAPKNTAYTRASILIRADVTAENMYIKKCIGIDDVLLDLERKTPLIKSAERTTENFTSNPEPELELGNISITANGWGYYSDNPNTRVRTKQGVTVSLNVGDTIGLTDYSDARFYLGWRRKDGTLGLQGWLYADFTVTEAGDYIIILSNRSDREQTGTSALGDLLVITHHYNYENFLSDETLEEELSINNGYSHYNVKSINHRGFNTVAPENTLVAYKISSKKGFYYVETDVDYTSDGVLVLIHDATINRTARNADGTAISATTAIHDITYNQALSYDFGIYKGSSYAGTKIPTFEQFMGLCKNLGLHPYIEIKFDSTSYIDDCITIVKNYGMLNNVTWICGTPSVLTYLSQQLPSANIGYVVNEINTAAISNASQFKTESNYVFIDANASVLTDSMVQMCIDADIPLEIWATNTSSYVLSMNPYISGVTTDSVIANRVLYDDAIET